MFTKALMAATGLSVVLIGQQAFAQDASDESNQETAADQEARQATVVVTGQKIERTLQDTQASVEVIDEIDILEENVIDLVDALERTANVTTGDGSSFVIRGINNASVSGAGQGDLASIYLDGITLPRAALFGAPIEIWDINQIEILRGPQSTLQGRASLAGAIIINTAEPTYDWSGRARAIYTTEEEATRFGVAIGGPIIEDQVAFRIAAETSESDGFNTNSFFNEPSDAIETESVRGKLLIEPSAISGLEINLTLGTSESSDGESFVVLGVDDPEEAREIPLNTRTRFTTKVDTATAIIDYELNDQWSLTSLTGWNEVDYTSLFDVNRDPNDDSISTFRSVTETLQQELRATYVNDGLELIFGGFIAEEEVPVSESRNTLASDLENDFSLSLLLQGPPFGLDAPTAGFVVSQYPNPFFVDTFQDLTQKIETWALYTDGSWELNDQWTLYGGFRYDVEKQSNTYATEVETVSPLPDPTQFPFPLDQIIGGVNGFVELQAENARSPFTGVESPEFEAFLPKLGARYQFDSDRSVSFTVQRGYRSGGVDINAAVANAYSFDQELTWNYELALRSQWFDGNLTLNGNLFYVDWTDQQVRIQLSNSVFDTEIQNAGASTVQGFEIETYYNGFDNLDLYGGIGYSQTEFEDFIVFRSGAEIDLSGNEFGGAPQWTLNAGATWRPTQNWIANVNANYADSAFLRADDFQFTKDIDARTLVNFRAGWENENFGVYLAGNNLFDEDYVISQFPNISNETTRAAAAANQPVPAFANFGDPRTFSIQLEARF